ncbi:hypothetical protein M413DRAFT_12290 [Hebeloma cylindrosporum]|uniref:Uncharacterized protein n=1 Tax=Hebeloma cylindrosporum TaxID=76867 RepID=A0A0C2XNW5_HEBCY|nr:hypothetical protein M413DRAFT_12290 [Hebeloma cylindrosporum h7]
MPCLTSDDLCTRISALDAEATAEGELGVVLGASNLTTESSGESRIGLEEEAARASTINQTSSGSYSPPEVKTEVQVDAITSGPEEISASNPSRHDDRLISEAERVGTHAFADEIYCICDGTADDDEEDIGNNDSSRPRFIVLPGESEEDPPRTYRFIYELGQSERWGMLQRRQSRIRKARKLTGFMKPKPSRLNAKGQHHRAYRARMAYLKCQVELAHCLGSLAKATNFEEDLWPELKLLLGLE